METNTVNELIPELLGEIKNIKKFFSINDCVAALLFKAILPLNDIVSDFLIAEKIYNINYDTTMLDKVKVSHFATMLMYFFIACPSFMVIIHNFGIYFDKFRIAGSKQILLFMK